MVKYDFPESCFTLSFSKLLKNNPTIRQLFLNISLKNLIHWTRVGTSLTGSRYFEDFKHRPIKVFLIVSKILLLIHILIQVHEKCLFRIHRLVERKCKRVRETFTYNDQNGHLAEIKKCQRSPTKFAYGGSSSSVSIFIFIFLHIDYF